MQINSNMLSLQTAYLLINEIVHQKKRMESFAESC